MAWLSFLDAPLDAVFGPVIAWSPLGAVILFSLIMTLLLTLAYKYLTDQNLMKQLKDETKALQAQMKELKDKPEEALKVQRRAMEVNMKYMMQSMKPTLFTMIPILLVFGWMSGALSYLPIMPGQEFAVEAKMSGDSTAMLEAVPQLTLITPAEQPVVDGIAHWALKADKGEYQLKVTHKNVSQVHQLKVDERRYLPPVSTFSDSVITQITVNNQKRIVLNLFGWQLGWLGSYIIFSIIFSIVSRKVLKVY
ncbi:MAG TPA: EMC3/TMCO1 family protein [Candidatus Nanoarchaeia archaeon]|nr:EMC3/TMCO1 family protein [Candidatus Nanoarchaeia archaeon]